MGGCSAINCSNNSKKKFRMFKFPADPVRRRKWTVNCRRDSWVPGPSAQLCIIHFEESQFEQNRQDGWKKLKQTAIPTLFDVPNPPETIGPMRVKGLGLPKPGTLLELHLNNAEQVPHDNPVDNRIAELEAENEKLIAQIAAKDKALQFLSEEQQSNSRLDKKSIKNWSQEGIIQALKLRFALGKFGYNYLRTTGYPSPSYSTLNRRMQYIKVNFGVLRSITTILKAKIDCMSETDRWCSLMIDEMEISKNKDFDVSEKRFIGGVTLGSKAVPGKHYTVVLLRGIKAQWKQVIAHEITGPSTSGPDMQNLLLRTVEACREIGLVIKATVSDMGSNNKALWKECGVCVTRNERKTSYIIGDDANCIHTVADVPHLIKNLRGATLSRPLKLPESICKKEDLPTRYVSSGHVKYLWISEINADSSLRSLHHLTKEHLFPTHFGAMNVATAVQFFSIKTAAALEKSVHLRVLSKDALTTAWWIRLVHQWFEIMTARHRKKGITVANREKKFEFLATVIDVVQNMELGKGWKPLQTGIIMSTLSVISLSTEAFCAGFAFFLPGRLTQDALENVFSQIRRKAGSKPTALQAKRALKLVCMSQFIADLKGTNYSAESDYQLFNIPAISDINLNEEIIEKQVRESAYKPLKASEENDVHYIAGATVCGVLKQKLCDSCSNSIKTAIDINQPSVPKHITLLTEYADMGGLVEPSSGVYRICRETEREIQHNKEDWVQNELPITQENIDAIKINCESVHMPLCCNLKEKIINYYLVVRCKGILNHLKNKAAYASSYGSASASKKCAK